MRRMLHLCTLILFLCVPGLLMAQNLEVVSILPSNGTTGVPTEVTITIEFSKAISAGEDPFVETPQIEYELRPNTTELDNAFESLSSDKKTVIITGVQLQANTQYSLLVSSATGADGSHLHRPAFTVFSTGSSLGGGSIQGKISATAGVQTENALVAAYMNSPFDETSYAGYALASGSGEFAIGGLPDGDYVVVALQDVNNNGTWDPSEGDGVGAYDGDNNKLADLVSIQGGSAQTGINFSLFVPSPQSAGQLEPMVRQFANAVAKPAGPASDAALVLMATAGNLTDEGKAYLWLFGYYSQASDTAFGFAALENLAVPGLPLGDEEDGMGFDTLRTPIPDGWMDSDAAFQISQQAGGADFMATYDTVAIAVIGAVLDPDELNFFGDGGNDLAKVSGPASAKVKARRNHLWSIAGTPGQLAGLRSGNLPVPLWLFLYFGAGGGGDPLAFEGLGFLIIGVHMLTGEAMILSPSFAFALANLQAAMEYALMAYSDAVLVGIHATMFNNFLQIDGRALFWSYIFWSAAANQFFQLLVSSGRVWDMETITDFPNQKPLPGSFVDSDAAMATAEANGGAAYRQAHPFFFLQVLLAYAIYQNDPNKLVWHVEYSDPTNPQEEPLDIFVDAETGNIVVGVEVTQVQGPKAFELEPVYPNPLKLDGNMNFTLSLQQPSRLQIALYNVLGQEVQSLYTGQRAAGRHVFSINELNPRLAPGVYYLRVQAKTLDGRVQLLTRPVVVK